MLRPFFAHVAGALLAASFLGLHADSAPAADWQRAIGPWVWSFPRDHGAHPAFKTEWWYLTGNLQDAHAHKFGYELTLFRQGVQFTPAQPSSNWAVRDIYFGHFAISDITGEKFHCTERVSRGSLGEAHAAEGKMDVAIGPWIIRQGDASEDIHLVASGDSMAIDFHLHPVKPLVLEGEGGLSRKANGVGQASYYYSYPRLATTGTLRLGDDSYDITGQSWFDHEFSTSSLGPDQVGWDWFCIQLDNNQEVMLYAMRDKSGAIDPVSEGTWVNADGTSQRLLPGSFTIDKLGTWTSPKSGAVYPAGWRVHVPGRQAEFTVMPALAGQELALSKMSTIDYWEGACTITGTLAGANIGGVGYTELTGYAGPLQEGMKQ